MTISGPPDARHRLVLVTGASGMIGRRLVDRLIDQRIEFVACCATAQGEATLRKKTSSQRVVRHDLAQSPYPASLTKGITDVVHVAGQMYGNGAASYFDVNCGLARNLITSLADVDAAISRIVFISSIAARGPGLPEDYSDPFWAAKPVSMYGRSKQLAELIFAASRFRDRMWILRPCPVVSSDDRRMQAVVDGMSRGVCPSLKAIPEVTSAVDLDDMADAILAALERPPCPAPVAVDIASPDPIDVARLVRSEFMTGRGIFVPGWVLKSMASAAELTAIASRGKPFLTHDKLAEMSHRKWIGDHTVAADKLKWSARRDVRTSFLGLARKRT